MAMNKELLEILCCPDTKVELKLLPKDKIEAINKQIAAKKVKYKDDKLVDKPLEEALITVDDKIIYRVDDEIPIMLIEMGIETSQLDNF